jgi:hypothetical protein
VFNFFFFFIFGPLVKRDFFLLLYIWPPRKKSASFAGVTLRMSFVSPSSRTKTLIILLGHRESLTRLDNLIELSKCNHTSELNTTFSHLTLNIRFMNHFICMLFNFNSFIKRKTLTYTCTSRQLILFMFYLLGFSFFMGYI